MPRPLQLAYNTKQKLFFVDFTFDLHFRNVCGIVQEWFTPCPPVGATAHLHQYVSLAV